MDHLLVPNGASSVKAKAVEDARKMQASVIDAANKADRDPPKYALKELIGKGSFGLVYKGKDVTTANVVAVKIVDVDENDTTNPHNADSYTEFLKEVNALKVLSENKAQNINHVIEALSVGKTMWIITEYCEGGSVATLMKPTAPGGLEEKWIIPILREVAEAIRWVHGVGIIHRDIKCSNVLVTEMGEVKLCDFGVAGTLETKLEKRSSFIGTPHWMAPELFDISRSYGKEVDIWSFGSLVYEIATGFPPNVKDGISCENLGSHLKTNAPRLEGDNFSKELRSLVAYCLELHASSRPTIEQVQRHPYLYSSHSFYPTITLSKLVKAYALWERRGNGRESLIMPSGATEPVDNVETEEWVFSTSVLFDKQSAFKGTEQGSRENNYLQIEVNEPCLLDSPGQGQLQRPSIRRSPPHALVPHQSPLEKAFDPNTTSSYDENSRSYYSPSSQNSRSDISFQHDNTKSSFQHSLVDLGDFGPDNLVSPSSIGLGITDIPERKPTWPKNENNYGSAMSSHKTPIRSESDSTAFKRTIDWKFPSAQQLAELKSDEAPFDDEPSHPIGRYNLRGRPSLNHYSTDPTGNQLRSCAMPTPDGWFSLRQSITDLDLGAPGFNSPLSSMANSELGPRSPFELGSPNLPSHRRMREPSLYIDGGSIPPMNLGSDNMVDNLGTLSKAREFESTSLFEVEDTSKSSATPSTAPSAGSRRQGRTSGYLRELPDPPSAATVAGDVSPHEMAREVTRLLDGMTGELIAFRDLYNSPTILAKKTSVKGNTHAKPGKD